MENLNTSQTEHFDSLSSQWWSQKGAFDVLHAMNPARIKFIKEIIDQQFPPKGLKNLKVLDVGCGGGIVCEPMARLGAVVTGLDASSKAIKAAKDHAHDQNLKITYVCGDLKNLKKTYDLVTCLEVIEHVDDLEDFLKDLTSKLNPGGVMILSTLNRTTFSYLVGIIGAEYITHKVPVGTHDWQKFIEPAALVAMMEKQGFKTLCLKGLNYSLLKREWILGGKLHMNYLAAFLKENR